ACTCVSLLLESSPHADLLPAHTFICIDFPCFGFCSSFAQAGPGNNAEHSLRRCNRIPILSAYFRFSERKYRISCLACQYHWSVVLLHWPHQHILLLDRAGGFP